jgi:hypothetical protein
MGQDHPDGTLPVALSKADIKIPVDIQAQYTDLDINIKSQAADVTIDIEAQSVGVHLEAEWECVQGNYKAIEAASANIAVGGQAFGDYTVPTGKVLYLCMLSAISGGHDAADRDLNQVLEVRIESPIGTNRIVAGGNAGFISSINPPTKITAGATVRVRLVNWSNHVVDARSFVTGYEI